MNTPASTILNNLFRERAWTLATAESCTGGLLGDLITNAPGSSDFFLGGVIAYSNRSKRELLGVGEDILKEDGPVSSRTALAMARGVKKLFASSIGAAITGIAGPGGGGQEKPVGLVYIAVVGPAGETVEKQIFSGTRREIKCRAAERTLALLIAAAGTAATGDE
ncbi:MAG: CinA family protein [Candidatus Erginobacter occultus]|nr:CinA family protein [Candidatus Erginobacter occultus]